VYCCILQRSVWPWGRWEFHGRCTDKRGERQFEAEIVAVTDEDVSGVLLRAPTKDEGMVRKIYHYELKLFHTLVYLMLI